MKIAFAIEHFSPEQGGAERYAWGFAQWLTRQGHTLDVFARRASPHCDFVRDVRIVGAFGNVLATQLAGQDYDIVQGFNHVWPCDLLRLGGGVHLAFERYNAMSAGSALARGAKRLSYCVLPRYRSQRASEREQFNDRKRHFIAVSQRVADDMKHYYPESSGRVHVIHNGVDVNAFNGDIVRARRSSARAELKLEPGTAALLFASNNFRLKGLHDLIRALPGIRAAARLPVHLLVAGRGHPEPFVRQAARLGVEKLVTFCGNLDDLRDAYAAADTLVHPSYYDAYGFVGLEAMACGLPVVISRNCGVSEIVTDGKGGVLIDMPCPAATIAAAVTRTLEPGFREEATRQNVSVAQRHTLEENYQKVLALYDAIIAEKRPAPPI